MNVVQAGITISDRMHVANSDAKVCDKFVKIVHRTANTMRSAQNLDDVFGGLGVLKGTDDFRGCFFQETAVAEENLLDFFDFDFSPTERNVRVVLTEPHSEAFSGCIVNEFFYSRDVSVAFVKISGCQSVKGIMGRET